MSQTFRPACCGLLATQYKIFIEHHSVEIGYYCKKCKRIRIPYQKPWTKEYRAKMEAEWEALRLEGIAFDESLSSANKNPPISQEDVV